MIHKNNLSTNLHLCVFAVIILGGHLTKNGINKYMSLLNEKQLELNKLSRIILDSAITVHKEMGPGLLEVVYEYFLLQRLSFNMRCRKLKKHRLSKPIDFNSHFFLPHNF